MPSTLAIVPARAGSKRLPNKNHRLLLGRPLVLWTVDFALSHGGFDLVVVSTDSPEIAALAHEAGAHVPWLRPAYLATDTATSIDVVLHAVDKMAAEARIFDRVALLQPTSPIRFTQRWTHAAKLLDKGAPAAIGVRSALSHPYWTYFLDDQELLAPYFPNCLTMRSQDLPTAYVPNGALYLSKVDALRLHRSFTPPGTRGVVCSEVLESVDIDTEEDWLEAERLIEKSRR
jgi:CMP-N,N'-diacetyllegionaminic acid synthase